MLQPHANCSNGWSPNNRRTNARTWAELATDLLALGQAADALAAAERADYLAQGMDAAILRLRAAALEPLDRGDEAAFVRARADGLNR
jgi:hypothetical protein